MPGNWELSFNSTLVQLKVPIVLYRFRISHCFNSTLVQLKDPTLLLVPFCSTSFNSTLVQLKANLPDALNWFVKFQFYLSSIKSPGNG